jgi:hypothetical protein
MSALIPVVRGRRRKTLRISLGSSLPLIGARRTGGATDNDSEVPPVKRPTTSLPWGQAGHDTILAMVTEDEMTFGDGVSDRLVIDWPAMIFDR